MVGLSILPYLNAYPLANGAELGSGLAQFNADLYRSFLTRCLQHSRGPDDESKVTVFGRYNYSPSGLKLRGGFPPRSAS